jgi:hypothetical protein
MLQGGLVNLGTYYDMKVQKKLFQGMYYETQ